MDSETIATEAPVEHIEAEAEVDDIELVEEISIDGMCGVY